MGILAAPSFSTLWQTYAAVAVSLCSWLLTTFVGSFYVTIFQPSGLTLWTLAVAGWCGVFVAHKACENLFPHAALQPIFFLFVVLSAFNPLLGYLNNVTALEQVGWLAQTLATLATAYPLFREPAYALAPAQP